VRTGNINHWQQNEKLCATSRRNNKKFALKAATTKTKTKLKLNP